MKRRDFLRVSAGAAAAAAALGAAGCAGASQGGGAHAGYDVRTTSSEAIDCL